jgi:hypothetical protein
MSIEAMKQALEALTASNSQPLPWWVSERNQESITSLRQAIREHALREVQRLGQEIEQEPVAWRYALDASVEGPRWIYIDKDPHQWLLGPAMAMAVIEKLFTHPPQRPRVVFPTMLRKMWSGGEVQAWLDENVNKEKNNG